MIAPVPQDDNSFLNDRADDDSSSSSGAQQPTAVATIFPRVAEDSDDKSEIHHGGGTMGSPVRTVYVSHQNSHSGQTEPT